ncbi:MAG: DEAD/DEAH box helicase [Coxiellaceae bacterium]|nr:DEAD/DEAH box helicase [Coxiellaceae bacterium]
MSNFIKEITTVQLSDFFTSAEISRGKNYFNSGAVLKLTQKNISSDIVEISATVKGSQSKPYQLTMIVEKLNNNEIDVDGDCSCPVEFNCKHVAAALFAAQQAPTSTIASQHRVLTAEKIKSPENSSAAVKWLDSLKTSLVKKPIAQITEKDPYVLVYILKREKFSQQRYYIQLMLSRILKSGAYGKSSRKYSFHSPEQQRYLSESDEKNSVQLQLLKKRSMTYAPENEVILLNEKATAACLIDIVKTGRCFWDEITQEPLSLADESRVDIQWEVLQNANQRATALVNNERVTLLFLDNPIAINIQKKLFIPVQLSEQALVLLEKLVSAPEIPYTLIKEVKELIETTFPTETSWLPTVFNAPLEKNNIDPIPIMHLLIENVKKKIHNFGFAQYISEEKPIAKIEFDYDGALAPFSFSNTAEKIEHVENNQLFIVHRNFEKEKSWLLQLEDKMQLAVVEEENLQPLRTMSMVIESLQTDEDITQFLTNVIPQLEYNGWKIISHHDVFKKVVDDTDLSWYSELEEESQYDYFGFKLGILVDDEKVNILPIIAEMIRKMSPEKLKSLSDDEKIFLPITKDKILSVPFKRIKPILETLVELFDKPMGQNDALKLSIHHAALLEEIKKAFSASQLRWLGGERLRALGKKLSEFQSIKIVKPPKTFLASLRGYQQEGLNWLQFLREYQLNGILADDMGLGKTVQTLAHLAVEKNKKRMQLPSLIVAPTSLMVNWKAEAKKFFPSLKVLVFHGNDRAVHADQLQDYDLVLTTYALILRDKALLMAQPFYYLILDEAQFIKNSKAKSTQIVHQLKAEHRLCLTGTPMENHLGELWSLFHFLMPGLLGDSQQFTRLFRTPIEKNNDEVRRASLSLRLKPFMLRRQKNMVAKELPPKTEIIRMVELKGAERDLYESIRLSMEKKVRDSIKQQGLSRSHIVILEALLKLRQVCCHPKLLPLETAKKMKDCGSKLELLRELLLNLVEEGRKIIIFSQFTKMIALIEEMLSQEKLAYVKLTGATHNREKPINAFQNGEVPIFLISLKAGGTGLNLTAADTVIHYDPWWNPAVEDQATDRAYRIGQNKPVFVYKLLTEGTVEETIQEMQQKKRALMEGLFSEHATTKVQLSSEDLKNLFRPL